MENDANPYAPPGPEAPGPASAATPRRPPSVIWMTLLFGGQTLWLVIRYSQAISTHGAALVWRDQQLLTPVLLAPLCFALCLVGHRSRIFYYVVTLLLGILLLGKVRDTTSQWRQPDAFSGMFVGDRVAEFLAVALFLWLFCRVTFGMPSRLYFGMARPQPVEEPAAVPAQVEAEAAAPVASSPPARWRPPPPDPAPYGRVLAECVAGKLERGRCVTDHHRDFCGMGLWFVHGHYCYDESWDGQPPDLEFTLMPNSRGGRVFKERAEFVEWLAAQSDHSLAGFEKEEFFHQNSTITRKRLWEQLGCR